MACEVCEKVSWYPTDGPCASCGAPNPLSKRAAVDALFGAVAYTEQVTEEGPVRMVVKATKSPGRPLDQKCGGGRRIIKKRLV